MPSISHNPLNLSGSSPREIGAILIDVSPLESPSKRKHVQVAGISESDASRTIDASMTQCQLDGHGLGLRGQDLRTTIEEEEDQDAPWRNAAEEWKGLEWFWLEDDKGQEVQEEEMEHYNNDDENYRWPDLHPIESIPDPETPLENSDNIDNQCVTSSGPPHQPAPLLWEAEQTLANIQGLINPKCGLSHRYKPYKLDNKTYTKLAYIGSLLSKFVFYEKAHPEEKGNWSLAASETAEFAGKSEYYARQLKGWA